MGHRRVKFRACVFPRELARATESTERLVCTDKSVCADDAAQMSETECADQSLPPLAP